MLYFSKLKLILIYSTIILLSLFSLLNFIDIKENPILSKKVMQKLISTDPLSQEVYSSIVKFRNDSIKRSKVSEEKFLETRSKFVT